MKQLCDKNESYDTVTSTSVADATVAAGTCHSLFELIIKNNKNRNQNNNVRHEDDNKC